MKTVRASLLATAAGACCLLSAGSAHAVDYDALEELFQEPVTTSATGAPQRASEAPATMEIVTAEQILRIGAHNIPDVLATLTGLDVRRVSQGGVDVSVRGYTQAYSPRLLVLVNGRQVYLDHYGYTNWDLVPVELSEIRQIEIVKGPAAALFGFNAVSGVVNIVTYGPMDQPRGAASVSAGLNNYREASGAFARHLGDNAGVRLSAGYYDAKEFDDVRASVLAASPTRKSVAGELQIALNTATQLGAEASYVESDRSEINPFNATQANEGSIWSTRIYGTSETPIGLIKGQVHRDEFSNHLLVPGLMFNFGNSLTVAQVEDVFKLGTDHTFRLAAEYRRNDLYGDVGDIELGVRSASAMWSWAITPRLSWTTAVRYDETRSSVGIPTAAPGFTLPPGFFNPGAITSQSSYNSGIVFRATNDDTLRLTTSLGAQAPSLLELVWNPRLEPATVYNQEVSYDHQIDRIDGGLRFNIFSQTLQHAHVFSVPFERNFGKSESWGGEFELRGVTADWNWKLGYIYQDVQDNLNNRGASGLFSESIAFEQATSEGIAVGQIGRTFGATSIDAFVRGVTDSEQLAALPIFGAGYTLSPVPGYVTTGLRIAHDLTDRVNLELSGQDLTGPNRQVFWYHVEPRVTLSLKAKF